MVHAETKNLERVVRFDRSGGDRHYRMAAFNLLAVTVYRNAVHPGESVRPRKRAGLTVRAELLAHISSLG